MDRQGGGIANHGVLYEPPLYCFESEEQRGRFMDRVYTNMKPLVGTKFDRATTAAELTKIIDQTIQEGIASGELVENPKHDLVALRAWLAAPTGVPIRSKAQP